MRQALDKRRAWKGGKVKTTQQNGGEPKGRTVDVGGGRKRINGNPKQKGHKTHLKTLL